MSVKVSIILNLDKIEYKDFIFIKNMQRQTLKEIEIIVFSQYESNSCADEYRDILAQDKKVCLYNCKADKSLFDIISGEYVYFADTSYMLENNALENMYNQAVHEHCDILLCNYKIKGALSAKQKKIYMPDIKNEKAFRPFQKTENLFNLVDFNVSNYLYKKSFIYENSLFPTEISTKALVEFLIKALLQAKYIGFNDSCDMSYFIGVKHIEYKSVFSALDNIYSYLIENDNYNIFLPAFFNCYGVLTYMILKNNVVEPEHSQIIRYIKKKGSLIYKFLHCNIYNQTAYKTLMCLFNYDIKKVSKYKKIINVIMPTNDYLAPYTGISLQSLIDNVSDEYFYNIYLLHDGLSDNAISRFLFLSNNDININFIDLTMKINNLRIDKSDMKKRISCIKTFIPKVFPDLNKVIWVDASVQLQRDIAILDNIDVNDSCIIKIHSANNDFCNDNDSIFIFNPLLCNKNLLTEKLFVLQKNFEENFSFELLQHTDIAQLCKDYFANNPETDFDYIALSEPLYQDKRNDYKWWQYARTTGFYEWLMYDFLTRSRDDNEYSKKRIKL